MNQTDHSDNMADASLRRHHTCVRVALLVCGIMLVGIWSNLFGYSALLLPDPSGEYGTTLSDWYVGGRLASALLFVVLARPLERRQGAIGLLVGIGLSPLVLIIALSARQGTADTALLSSTTLLPLGAFAAGIGFLLLSVPLFIRLIHELPSRWAALATMVGIVGECAVSSALSFYGSLDVQLIACTIAPAASGLCLFASERLAARDGAKAKTEDDNEAESAIASRPQDGGMPRAYDARNFFGTALMLLQLSFAMVLASSLRSLSSIGPWGLLHEGYLAQIDGSLPLVCLIVATLTLLIFVAPRRLPSQVKCALALVVVLAGLQMTASHLGTAPDGGPTVAAITMGCQLFCRAIIWITFMECVRQLRIPPFRINGIACLFNVAGSLLFSGTASFGIGEEDLVIGIVYVLLCVTVIAIALPSIGSVGSFGAAERRAHRESDDSDDSVALPSRTLHSFASAHGVSAREEEVLALLLDGCTRGQIERLLGLSEGTVRTHVNAVYRKVDVHSKEQLHQAFADWTV